MNRQSDRGPGMVTKRALYDQPTNELRKDGAVVGVTDRIYPVVGSNVTFEDVVVRGDLSGDLDYNGARLRVTRVASITGLEITSNGARGPVWKGVECVVLARART